MQTQLTSLTEGYLAESTVERLGSCVYVFMLTEILLARKSIVTGRALVFSDMEVHSLNVPLQVEF